MFATVLSEVTGQLDKRFILNAFFPTLVFALLMVLVVVSGTAGTEAALEWWADQPAVIQTLIVIGAVATVFVVANVVAASMLSITRLFEGYAFPAALFAGPARHYQLSRSAKANGAKRRWQFPLFPTPLEQSHLAPTRLGNVLRNSETYPRARYGIDPVRTWPLLYHVIPEALRTSLNDARSSMELLLVVAFWSGLFAPLASILLLCFGGSLGWVIAAVLGGAGVSALAYLASLSPARVYGSHVRAAFDMHRFELLEALRLPRPATLGEEKLTWPLVVPFLDEGGEHTWRYVTSE